MATAFSSLASTFSTRPTGHARLWLATVARQVNAAGVLANPHDYLLALKAARELIDQVIALHGATNWPAPSDYHAL